MRDVLFLFSSNVMCSCAHFWSWFCFFFFKQKTAYEMRISDWSSDVCSSDLLAFPNLEGDVPDGAEAPRALAIDDADLLDAQHRRMQIGRASCRERVCQYV